MDEPAVEDGTHYPKGRFSIGGPEQFVSLMTEAGVARALYHVWAGYVPWCFEKVPETLRFSLVILDLDHYRPTATSLAWVAPRLSAGGILALDDFVPAHDAMATKAIREFLATAHGFRKIAFFNQQLILQRNPSHNRA